MLKFTQTSQKVAATAILVVLSVLVPLFMPARIVIEPASFLFASHVAIFLAMFISPWSAVAVVASTTLGFALGAFAPVVILRAGSHLFFAVIGAMYLRKYPETMDSIVKMQLFAILIALIHGMYELVVVGFFYFDGTMGEGYYKEGYVLSVIMLVGLGSVVHSMVDFEIAMGITKLVNKLKSQSKLKIEV